MLRVRIRRALAAPVGTALLAVGLSAFPGVAHAQTQVACDTPSLVAAINLANVPGGGTLDLTPNCVYTLTAIDNNDNGLPQIANPVTINGNGATITRSSAADFRIFEVIAGGNLSLTHLTLSGGNVPTAAGGAVAVTAGTLDIRASRIRDNHADFGGGIYNYLGATTTVSNSSVDRNTANQFGGAIDNAGTATVRSSAFRQNRAGAGGALANSGTAAVENSALEANSASGALAYGGGVYSLAGSVSVSNTELRGNRAFSPNAQGGAIANTGTSSLSLRHAVVIANVSSGAGAQGGGIFNSGLATLTRSFVFGNRSTTAPGGINNSGTISLVATFVIGNIPSNCLGSATPVVGCFG